MVPAPLKRSGVRRVAKGDLETGRPKVSLVLSREWGNGLVVTIIRDYIGPTIGIHSPMPY